MNDSRMLAGLIMGALLIAITAGGAGCVAQEPGPAAPAELGGIPWPPPDGGARLASDDVISLLGKQFASKGGDTVVNTDNLDFTAGASLPYAIYTLPGFRPEVEIGGVGASFTLTEGAPGDGTTLYVGVSNYARGAWEWYSATPGDWDQALTNGSDYRSTLGKVSIAVLLWRGGSASVSEVRFARAGQTTLTAPQGLTASANVGRVSLDWQDVFGALGYNAYRATEPDFPSPSKMNTNPVLTSDYADTSVQQDIMYYYKATAVAGANESPMSNMVDIYSPQYNLPLPTNTRVTDTGPGTATVAWDYEDSGVAIGFEIFFSTTPNFSLNQLWKPPFGVNSSKRAYQVIGLADGTTYYWRVCAYNPMSKRGRMTDDIPTTAGPPPNQWQWGPIEALGPGKLPVSAIVVSNDISAAYLYGSTVMFARRNSGSWSSEDCGLDAAAISSGFVDYCDIAYGNSKYIICSLSFASDDLWASIGQQGGPWNAAIADGDGDTTINRQRQGWWCKAAADDNDYALIDVYRSQDKVNLHVRPASGGSWSTTTIRSGIESEVPPFYSLAFNGGDLAVLAMNQAQKKLFLGLRSSSYTLNDIANSGGANRGLYNDLQRVGGQWMTTAYDETSTTLYSIQGSGSSWTTKQIATTPTPIGLSACLAPNGASGAFAVFESIGPPDKWWLGIYDGSSWQVAEIIVTGTVLAAPVDIVALGGSPYILFYDYSGTIKCAKGTPP